MCSGPETGDTLRWQPGPTPGSLKQKGANRWEGGSGGLQQTRSADAGRATGGGQLTEAADAYFLSVTQSVATAEGLVTAKSDRT